MKSKIDPFTQRRLFAFIESHRTSSGQLPTLQDLGRANFAESLIDQAVRDGLIEQLYINLTNGPVVKGYKIKTKDIV